MIYGFMMRALRIELLRVALRFVMCNAMALEGRGERGKELGRKWKGQKDITEHFINLEHKGTEEA